MPIDGVTPELRRQVKAMSYGLVYGLSAFGLSQQLSIPAGEAKQIMESYSPSASAEYSALPPGDRGGRKGLETLFLGVVATCRN